MLHPSMDADDIIHPGPIDASVLSQHGSHRTEAIWNTQVCDVKGDPSLLTTMVERLQFNFEQEYVRFLGVYPDCFDKSPAMEKRSCLVNHLAHIPIDADEGTLKKYARPYLLTLIGSTLFTDKSGKTIPLYFLPLLEHLDRVCNYSWASAVLAYLYSNMCTVCKIRHNHLAGAPLIIQFSSWDRLSRIGVPTVKAPIVLPPPDAEFDPALCGAWSYVKLIGPKSWIGIPQGSLLQYRDAIQKMQPGDFTWRPYNESMFEFLNPTCLEGRDTTWRANVPLICFNIIGWHHPARVARHYGLTQLEFQINATEWIRRRIRIGLSSTTVTLPCGSLDMRGCLMEIWCTRPRVDDVVEEAGDDDAQKTRPSRAYRPDSHMIPENIRGYVICARDASQWFLNSTDDYSRTGLHRIFHTAYTEVGKLTDPIIVGVDPRTVTLDAVADDIGGHEDYDINFDTGDAVANDM
ncbi:hypothetical protein QQ045_022282 [Rhodiola kirilowii]